MDNIIVPGSNFNYNTLALHTPIVVSGGNHFLKINMDDEPIYIQSPKCSTKQGILKSGKKMYCDLVFTNENEDFIHWIEYLEEHIQTTIYKNKDRWFESSLELKDIEDSFTSPFKIYKSGKFYLLRVNIPCRLGTCGLKIFKESGNETVDIENITPETKIITILEIQGVKCSAKSFQIEIEVKQMMVLEDKNLFEKCIIKPAAAVSGNAQPLSNAVITSAVIDAGRKNVSEVKEPKHVPDNTEETIDANANANANADLADSVNVFEYTPVLENTEGQIKEFDIDMDVLDKNEPIQIKERNDVYYEMYKTALSKAKTAKLLAVSSFLEAKRIKNKYMIEDDDTDDEYENTEDCDVDYNSDDTENDKNHKE